MSNADYDFAKDRYFILSITTDGPSRLEGHKTYEDYEIAEAAAKRFLERGYRSDSVIIAKVADLVCLKVTTELTSRSERQIKATLKKTETA